MSSLRTWTLGFGLPLLLLLAVACSLCAAAPGEKQAVGDKHRGKVVAIADGDTLTLLVGTTQLKVRLWGIDAPEKAQAFGTRSKQGLADASFGREAEVEVMGHDRYGRTLGRVRVAGRDVNLGQVKAGLAWWYAQYSPKAFDIQAAELAARKARVGLWVDVGPVAPWEFRKAGRPAR